jgi:hypothetical protein
MYKTKYLIISLLMSREMCELKHTEVSYRSIVMDRIDHKLNRLK